MPTNNEITVVNKKTYSLPTGWPAEKTTYIFSACKHKFVDNDKACGICSKCDYVFDWKSTFDPTDAGTYKLLDQNYVPRRGPYTNSSKVGFCIAPNSVEVLGSVTNAYGNTWFLLGSWDNPYFVYSKKMQLIKHDAAKVTCTNFAPANEATIKKAKYNLTGTVKSNYSLKSIEGYLDGVKYDTWTAGDKTTTTVNLKDTVINKNLKFASLSTGKHTITLKAYGFNNNTAVTFHTSVFYVGNTTCSHSYSYNVAKLPTTAAAGTLKGTCSKCSATKTVDLPKLNTTNYTYKVTKAATCKDAGTGCYTWKNTTYGARYFYVSIAKTAHSWSSATCTKPQTCTVCSATSGPATGHKWSNATCTKPQTCTVCSATSGSAAGHKWSSATCTKPRTCTVCSATTGSVTAHAYLDKITAPTCTTQGYTTHTCRDCGDSYTDGVLGALGHKYGDGVCTRCGDKPVGVQITKQPKSVTVAEGKKAKVTIKATGEGLTYKWYYKNEGASKFKVTNTFKGKTYSTTMNDSRDGRQIYCVITDKYGNKVQTQTVTLSMAEEVKVTKQPKSVTVAEGKKAKVTVSAAGEGLTYTWYYKNEGASKFKVTNTFKGKTYSTTMNDSRDGRQVYCVITDKYGNSVRTKTVTLSMKETAEITKQPKSVTVANGKTAKVTFKATGDGLTYKWYYKDAGASKFSVYGSVDGNTYAVTMNSRRDGRQVYCVISDKYGNSVKTKTVTLRMS